MIIAYVIGVLLLSWSVGLVFVAALQTAFPFSLIRFPATRLTVPVLGFIFLTLGWWFGTFVLNLANATVEIVGSAMFAGCIVFLMFRKPKRAVMQTLVPAKGDWPVLFVMSAVFATSAWSYVVAGLGHFFLWNETDYFARVTPSILNGQNAGVAIATSHADPVYRILLPLQISNTMLLEYMLNVSANDAALLQLVTDLVLTAIGVYWLATHIFRLPKASSAIAAIFGVIGQFYFHTYLEGHIGSTIYTCGAPYLLGMVVWALATNKYRSTVLPICLLAYFMQRSYPFVINLLVIPVVLAKIRLVYIGSEQRMITASSGLLKRKLSVANFRTLWIVVIAVVLVPSYVVARQIFYPFRVSAILQGASPDEYVTNWHVLSAFFGLTLSQGFDYGLSMSSSLLTTIDIAAVVLAVTLGVATVVGLSLARHSAVRSFLAVFMVSLPLIACVFGILYPLAYFVHKVLYVHYFMAPIAITYALRIWQKQRWSLARYIVYPTMVTAICIVATMNVVSAIRDSASDLAEVQRADIHDMSTFATQLRQSGISNVRIRSDSEILKALMTFAVTDAGVSIGEDLDASLPYVSSQRGVFDTVPSSDVTMESKSGKFVLSNRTLGFLSVSSNQPPNVNSSRIFEWLQTERDYSEPRFENETAHIHKILEAAGSGTVCNDLYDSEYFAIVQQQLERGGLTVPYDPRKCTYFVRLNRTIKAVSEGANGSVIIAPFAYAPGRHRVVERAYPEAAGQRLTWQGELLELDYVPVAHRRLSTPADFDARRLLSLIVQNHLEVVNEISNLEYERYFLQSELEDARIHESAEVDDRSAVLVLVPEFILREPSFAREAASEDVIWQTSRRFALNQAYRIMLVRSALYHRLDERLRSSDISAWNLPLRTFLSKSTSGDFLRIRVPSTTGDLKVLLESGPSLTNRVHEIRAMRVDGLAEPLVFRSEGPNLLLSLPVRHFSLPGEKSIEIDFEPTPEPVKRFVLAYGSPILSYRLLACQLVSTNAPIYTARMLDRLRADRSEPDVLAGEEDAVSLGTGWYQPEVQNGRTFRWMYDKADVAVDGDALLKSDSLRISGEIGPSVEAGPLRVKVFLNKVFVNTEEITPGQDGEADITVSLGSPTVMQALSPGQNVVSLEMSGGDKSLQSDTRLLNYRAFSVHLVSKG